MYSTRNNRFLSVLVASLAAISLAAAPALGSEEDDDDGEENVPAQVVPAQPVPVVPMLQAPVTAPAPARPVIESNIQSEHESTARGRRPNSAKRAAIRSVQTRTVAQRAAGTTTVPRGGVAAGAGAMAPGEGTRVLLVLGGALIVLIVAGSGLIALGRRS